MTATLASPWLLAVVALVPPLCAALVLVWRGAPGDRFAGVQLASAVTLPIVAAMSFAFDQASSIDLAMTFGILTLPAALLYATVIERWL